MPKHYSFNEQLIELENESPVAGKGGAMDFQNISALSADYGRKLFNVQFSQRFTTETPAVNAFSRKDTKNDTKHSQFLRNQFVSIQEYIKNEERHQFYLYNMNVDDTYPDLSRCQIEFGA